MLMVTQNKRLLGFLLSVPLLLLIPLIGMQLTTEVNWSPFDFLVAGLLLLSTAFVVELILRKVRTLKGRLVLCLLVIVLLSLLWAELAVGLLGTPFAGS